MWTLFTTRRGGNAQWDPPSILQKTLSTCYLSKESLSLKLIHKSKSTYQLMVPDSECYVEWPAVAIFLLARCLLRPADHHLCFKENLWRFGLDRLRVS